MTYTGNVLRALLFALPYVVLTLAAILLDEINAGPEAGFGVLCLILVLTGVGIGVYVARHEGPSSERRGATASRREARAGR